MCDSFYLTNVIPLNNQHYWREIEEHCRSLTGTFRDVRVISGPVFLPDTWANTAKEKRFVRYEVNRSVFVLNALHTFGELSSKTSILTWCIPTCIK